MDRIHHLLNCAYADFTSPDYVESFMAQRSAELSQVMGGGAGPEEGVDPPGLDAVLAALMALSEGFEPVAGPWDQGFETRRLLGFALKRLAGRARLEPPFPVIIQTLQKRFEVNHRLFTRYDGSLHRCGEDDADLRVYALAALVLMLLFLERRNFNHLNTAIKLNDLLLKSGWLLTPQERPFVRAAVELELRIVLREYETHPA
jgi:hypothetical protein